MCEYIEAAFGLPHSSYDLWEENYAISTYTEGNLRIEDLGDKGGSYAITSWITLPATSVSL